jgi:cytoskeletal protein RodZ
VGGNQCEAATLNQERKASLGESLVAARQRQGLSREAVAQQTHIPTRYLQMLEDDDYRLISDQVYLLPFLRTYANFLDIDQDETAMRLLREVQRADNRSSPVSRDEPLDQMRRYKRRNWSRLIMFSGLIAVIIGAYIAQSRHKDADTITSTTLQSPQAALVSPPPFATIGTSNSFSAAQSLNPTFVNRSHAQQATSERATSSRDGKQAVNQAMTVRIVGGDEPTKLPRRNNPHGREALNH